MKAQSLSINLTGPCNAKCPFCISRLTWKTGVTDNTMLLKRLPQALRYAAHHNVDTVLITGSGEPTHPTVVGDMRTALIEANKFIPNVELQTNGKFLLEDNGELKHLATILGLNTLAISIADPDPMESSRIMGLNDFNYLELVEKAASYGLLIRISLNLTKTGVTNFDPTKWAADLKTIGVHQLVFRELGKPNGDSVHHQVVQEWIDNNKLNRNSKLFRKLKCVVQSPGRHLRTLPYGAEIYDFQGLSTCLTTCMTDNINTAEIRSLILQPDGHVYHSWNFEGSILL